MILPSSSDMLLLLLLTDDVMYLRRDKVITLQQHAVESSEAILVSELIVIFRLDQFEDLIEDDHDVVDVTGIEVKQWLMTVFEDMIVTDHDPFDGHHLIDHLIFTHSSIVIGIVFDSM